MKSAFIKAYSRMRIKIILAMLSCFLFFSPVYSEMPRKFTYYGVGNDKCDQLLTAFSQKEAGKFIQMRGAEWHSKSRAYIDWTLGYITAFNEVNSESKNLAGTDQKKVAAWLEKWCKKNPGHPVRDATRHLIKKRTGYMPGPDYLKPR
jgi:hypothetical protein